MPETSLHEPSVSSRALCAAIESSCIGNGYSPNTAAYSARYASAIRHAVRIRLPLTDTWLSETATICDHSVSLRPFQYTSSEYAELIDCWPLTS